MPRLSPTESLILGLLVRGDDMYGLELVAASGGRVKRGTVYVTLGRMEDKGLIVSRLKAPPPEAGGMPRRVYRATAFGHRVLNAWTHAVALLKPESAS